MGTRGPCSRPLPSADVLPDARPRSWLTTLTAPLLQVATRMVLGPADARNAKSVISRILVSIRIVHCSALAPLAFRVDIDL